MTDRFSAHGQCLCQAVTFTAETVSKHIGACHCTLCRTWSGAPFLGLECGSELEFDGPVSVYASSDWAERGFCGNCGTHLFYRLKDSNKYIMPAGLFDGQADLVFDHQIFIDEKPIYYSFSNATQTMTSAEVFAAYAPKE